MTLEIILRIGLFSKKMSVNYINSISLDNLIFRKLNQRGLKTWVSNVRLPAGGIEN